MSWRSHMKRLNTFSSHWSHTDAASIWVCTCHCHQRGRWRGGAKPFTMTKRKWQGQTIACGITVTPYCKQAYLTWQLWIPIHVWSRCWRYFWYAVKKKFIENRRRSQQWELPWCYRYRGVWIFEHLRDEQYIIIYLFVPLHTLQWLNDLRISSLWMELLFNSHSWQASLKCCSLGQFPVIPDFSDTECWAN